jgi:hypothetical protein
LSASQHKKIVAILEAVQLFKADLEVAVVRVVVAHVVQSLEDGNMLIRNCTEGTREVSLKLEAQPSSSQDRRRMSEPLFY